ncbi:MAG: YitT family protein [Emergencia sp.]|nr:YitT family protein [Emergencia sp.]
MKQILNYAGVLLGIAVAAFGVVAFVLPTGIMIGSATGIGRVIQYFYGVPVSYTVGVCNGVLFLIGIFFLGKKFAASTVIGTFAYPLFMNIYEKIPEFGELTDNCLIATLYGGALIGLGMGIVIKLGASIGGTDIIAIVLNDKLGFPLGLAMYIVDFLILLSQVIFSENSEQLLLGVMLTFLYSMVADKVVLTGGGAIQMFIISSKHEEIRRCLADMVVGSTVFYGESGYYRNERDILLCVINSRELAKVQSEVLLIDKEAFITINSIKEVKGRGYSFDVGRAKQIRKQKTYCSNFL